MKQSIRQHIAINAQNVFNVIRRIFGDQTIPTIETEDVIRQMNRDYDGDGWSKNLTYNYIGDITLSCFIQEHVDYEVDYDTGVKEWDHKPDTYEIIVIFTFDKYIADGLFSNRKHVIWRPKNLLDITPDEINDLKQKSINTKKIYDSAVESVPAEVLDDFLDAVSIDNIGFSISRQNSTSYSIITMDICFIKKYFYKKILNQNGDMYEIKFYLFDEYLVAKIQGHYNTRDITHHLSIDETKKLTSFIKSITHYFDLFFKGGSKWNQEYRPLYIFLYERLKKEFDKVLKEPF